MPRNKLKENCAIANGLKEFDIIPPEAKIQTAITGCGFGRHDDVHFACIFLLGGSGPSRKARAFMQTTNTSFVYT
jgi:hypothetical protein